jgi:HD-like signal output (HDOD) protein
MPVTKQVTLNFEDFLPPAPVGDPFQAQFRVKLIELLRSQGEILPSAESTLGRLWRLVNSDSSSIEDCVRVIEIDPAMTTRVFRVANSASCGGRATNISEAVLHLGFARLRELVFNAGIFAQFSQLHLPPGWNHFWIRNILIARLTERLASAYFQTNGTEYLAGLLHDIGWLNLATFFPEEFNMILSNPLPIRAF